jgi:hypothetical protein
MILKKETVFLDANAWNDSDTVQKFEVMDGTPVRGFFFFFFYLIYLY